MTRDEKWMRLALRLARRGLGHTSPNPAVGALIVSRDGRKLLARGWHRAAGQPHAEIEALRALARPALARGATLYVTLEPCSTHGRTPPCVEAILASGLRRVVIAAVDPNPLHAGRGLALLRAAGLDVTSGLLAGQAAALNPAFNHWITTGLPYVIAKCGMSLDGRIARPPGFDPWITSETSRAHAHQLRARVDAILIGAGTLRADNPHLTVRGVKGARQPWRVVLTRSGQLPAQAHLFTDAHRDRTLVFRGRSLRQVLRSLGRRQITSVLLEGGMDILGQAFAQKLVHHLHFYLAPAILGGPLLALAGFPLVANARPPRLLHPVYRPLGTDLLITGDVTY